MGALTKDFPSSSKSLDREPRPIAAGKKGFKGGLAMAYTGGSPGFYGPADGAAAGKVVGYFYEDFDNTAGGDGAISAQIVFGKIRHLRLFDNDTAGTPVTVADRETTVHALDDHTITKAVTTTTSPPVYDVTSEGVWIDLG